MSDKIDLDPKADAETIEISSEKKETELAVTYQIDPEEEKLVRRKLDRVILPLMALIYFFQCKCSILFSNVRLTCVDLDKQSINYAAVFGLSEDLGLSGSEFSWAISLFYFGQFCSEYPAAYLMSRLPITIFVGVTV